MSVYKPRYDVDLTNEHHDFLKTAGASDELLKLIAFSPETAGVPRHSTREEVEKYVEWGDLDLDRDPAEFRPIGGHFFEKMWNGDLFGAWLRADLNNKSLMAECFGEADIIQNGIESGQPASYVATMVEEAAL